MSWGWGGIVQEQEAGNRTEGTSQGLSEDRDLDWHLEQKGSESQHSNMEHRRTEAGVWNKEAANRSKDEARKPTSRAQRRENQNQANRT